MKRLSILIGGSLFLWLALLFPAHQLGGDQGVFLSGVALALCLLPAAGTMLLISGANKRPELQPLLALAGTGIRLGVVLGGGLLLHLALPERFPQAFWLWLLVFYMFTLALEMVLLLRPPPHPYPSPPAEEERGRVAG